MNLCSITTGYNTPCRSIGGIKNIFIGEISENVIYGYNIDNSIGSITNIQPYYQIETDPETASLTQTGEYSVENGTAFYTKTIEFTLHGLNQPLIEFITTLGKGSWSIVFEDNTNQYWLLDPINRVNVSASAPQLGKAFGDLNGAVITMETKGSNLSALITGGFMFNQFVNVYQDAPSDGGDTYTEGTYHKTLQFLSGDYDLFTDLDLSTNYYLPSDVDGDVIITIGPLTTEEKQSVSISVSNITRNYGIPTFYLQLSSIYGIPFINHDDSVIFKSFF